MLTLLLSGPEKQKERIFNQYLVTTLHAHFASGRNLNFQLTYHGKIYLIFYLVLCPHFHSTS